MIALANLCLTCLGVAYIVTLLVNEARKAEKARKKMEERLTEEIKLTLLTPAERRSLHSRYTD
nr:hypothetical protein [Rhodococcus sp. (in: high G+C Gram-positive bacteria)]